MGNSYSTADIKPNQEIRFCGDFKFSINKFVKCDNYPFRKLEDILARLQSGIHFTKIDLNPAYLHLLVNGNSQDLFRSNAAIELFRIIRLLCGIAGILGRWVGKYRTDLSVI